jgi:hypothetical protein
MSMAIAPRPDISDLLLILVFTASFAVMAATYGGPNNWIAHALLGTVSLVLILQIDLAGAMTARRVGKPLSFSPFPVHKKASAQFLALSIGSFLLGVWIRSQHGDPVLATAHGWTGLAICMIAVPQWLSCRYKVRKVVKRLHQLLGYGLAAIVIIQISLGAWMAYFPGSLG